MLVFACACVMFLSKMRQTFLLESRQALQRTRCETNLLLGRCVCEHGWSPGGSAEVRQAINHPIQMSRTSIPLIYPMFSRMYIIPWSALPFHRRLEEALACLRDELAPLFQEAEGISMGGEGENGGNVSPVLVPDQVRYGVREEGVRPLPVDRPCPVYQVLTC